MITLARLTRRHRATTALVDLSLDLLSGAVTGAPETASTGEPPPLCLRVGVTAPVSGRSPLDDTAPAAPCRPPRGVGISLTARASRPRRSVRRHLVGVARTQGTTVRRVDEVLETVGLADLAKRRVGTLSANQRQRLGIAGALLGDPLTLLFDEPADGLDPRRGRWARQVIQALTAEAREVPSAHRAPHGGRGPADAAALIARSGPITEGPREQVPVSDALNAVRVRTPQPDVLRRELVSLGMSVRTSPDGALLIVGGTLEEIGGLAFRYRVPLHELSPRWLSPEGTHAELTATSVPRRPRGGPAARRPPRWGGADGRDPDR